MKTLRLPIAFLLIFSIGSLYAAETRSTKKSILNGTTSTITVTYYKCINFEGKIICSDDKKVGLKPGQTKYFEEYPKGTYRATKITDGINTRKLATDEEVSKGTPVDKNKIATCTLGINSVITKYSGNFFCELHGE